MMSARSGASTHRHMQHHRHLFHKKPPPLAGEPDELDVFEATRYFAGALTDGGGGGRGGRGYASAYEEDEVRAPPRRGQKNAGSDERRLGGRSTAVQQMKAAEILKKKLHKQPSSPGAKLVSYLNSLFNQAASRRKLKCLNPVRDTPEDDEDEEDEEDDEAAEIRGHALTAQRENRRSIGDSPFGPKSSHLCGSSSFATPHVHPNPVVPGSRRPEKDYRPHAISSNRRPDEIRERENRWVLNKNDERLRSRRPPDWFLQEHEFVPAPLAVPSGGRAKSFSRRRDADHEDEDDLSDSSSDLFELKIYGQSKSSSNGAMPSSDGLPVFATTDIEAFKREAAATIK